MGKIKVLAPADVQKIAAGEVVERPANVVKELVENALDAGAQAITLFVEDGGKKLIKIIDNGCGMSLADAQACILNHATSKLSSVHELPSVRTFGFRGEALASMAAVSHMRMVTKEPDAPHGIALTIQEALVADTSVVACNAGTEISIADLFYNLPARQKFLKKRETEWHAINQTMQAFALGYQDRTFTVYHDNNRVLHAPRASSLKERFLQVFGQAYGDAVGEISETSRIHHAIAQLTVSGLCMTHERTRYDRSGIFIFVNGRWVKNPKLTHAFVKGYDGILPPQQYPLGCVLITIDPGQVDINIHPRKEEVQFVHPRVVEMLVEEAVRATIGMRASTALGFRSAALGDNQQDFKVFISPAGSASAGYNDARSFRPASNHAGFAGSLVGQGMRDQQKGSWGAYQANEPEAVTPESGPGKSCEWDSYSPLTLSLTKGPKGSSAQEIGPQGAQQGVPGTGPATGFVYNLLGQIFATYILLETESGLVLIDQHAAHEKVFFEQFMVQSEQIESTRLLIPLVVNLSVEDSALLEAEQEWFASCGISIDRFSESQWAITAVPVYLKQCSGDELVHPFLASIREGLAADPAQLREKLFSLVACKAAVKAGDVLTDAQMHNLVSRLHALEYKTTCPHGRPTMWVISPRDLEKRFQRIT